MSGASPTLADYGELRLIDEVLLPLARVHDPLTKAGDDCAYIPSAAGLIAVTADVGPKPLLHSLPGYEDDLEAAGWLAVVATASDIATAGARPLFLTNCIDAPPNMTVEALSTLLGGYFRALSELGFRNGGGDIRHGPVLGVRVFGAGAVEGPQRPGRGNARAGDRLVVIGPAGEFMATYLLAAAGAADALRDGRLTPQAEAVLRFPRPQLRQMQALCHEGLVRAASDTSDGLLGALDNLARSSRCAIHMDLDEALLSREIHQAAEVREVDSPWNIFVAWGDWSVVAAVPADRFASFESTCRREGVGWLPLGTVVEGEPAITALHRGRDVAVLPLRNENFVSRGFNAGISGHLDYMFRTPLFSPLEAS